MTNTRSGLRTFGRQARAEARRGATLVTVCISVSVLLGMVGVGVDLARAYAFKTQLKTATDAAAMAGVIDLNRGFRGATPGATATAYVPRNTINGLNAATVQSVQAVEWNFVSKAVTNTFANWDPTAVNGVRVTATYSVPLTFARIFGLSTIPITETTVAALGGVGGQSCLRPWAVHYRALLNQLDASFPLASGPRPTSYNLTNDDIAFLSSNNQLTTLLQNNQDMTSGGNIAQVATWKDEYGPASSGNAYRDAIRGIIPCNMMRSFAPGDLLPGSPGAGAGQTRGAFQDFCSANGGATGGNGTNNPVICTGTPAVRLILYTDDIDANGANQAYRVKMSGVFKLKGYQPPGEVTPCSPTNGSADAMICGYFTTGSTEGAFTGAVGLTFKPAIVY